MSEHCLQVPAAVDHYKLLIITLNRWNLILIEITNVGASTTST